MMVHLHNISLLQAPSAMGLLSLVVIAALAHSIMAPLRLGTDCSGLGTPYLALQRLGVDSVHLWASDTNRYARIMLRLNCRPDDVYRDIYSRRTTDLPTVDLYCVGFPCQPFSQAGQRMGFDDEDNGGKIFFRALHYIRQKCPRVFLMENVDGIQSVDEGSCLQRILHCLIDLEVYNIYWQVVNTKECRWTMGTLIQQIVGAMCHPRLPHCKRRGSSL
jgi:DNA (cytosine-5)-methyltransferase 1